MRGSIREYGRIEVTNLKRAQLEEVANALGNLFVDSHVLLEAELGLKLQGEFLIDWQALCQSRCCEHQVEGCSR